MENLKELQRFIWNLGWFSKSIKLTITLENQFEGFYNRASEDWEKQVVIKLESPDETKCPNITVIGKRFDGINEVSGIVFDKINEWKLNKINN